MVNASGKPFIFIAASASGAASLVYLLVWMHSSVLVFGDTALVTLALAVTFIGGLTIGTWIGGRLADCRPHLSLIAFAAIELAAGLYGFASLRIFHLVASLHPAVYPSSADHGHFLTGVQLTLSALVMLPPAILMGGSLPLLARRAAVNESGLVRGGGEIYGFTALGAAAGAVAMTYGLLPAVGLTSTVALAAALNVLVGVVAFSAYMLARKHPAPPDAASVTSGVPGGVTGDSSDHMSAFLILIAFTISGLAVMTFELGWVRLAAMVMGASIYVYTASIVIALTGIGIGSALYGYPQRTSAGHQRWFALLAFLMAFTFALSLILLQRIPFLFARYFPLFRNSFGRQIAAQFIAAAVVMLLPSLLFGAMFPAIIGSLGVAADRVGSTIAVAYVANMIGMVAGACLAELALIPTVGLRAAMDLGVLAAVAAGVGVWWCIGVPKLPRLWTLSPAAAALLVVGILPPWPREVFAAGIGVVAPRLSTDETFGDIVKGMRLLYYHDGRSATISVDKTGQTLFFRSNGKTESSTDPADIANQLLLGHLPMLLHPAPRDILVLGLGTGMAAAAVARYPVQRIDIVEPEPAVAQAARLFDSYTRKVLDDPRVHLIMGDSRNRLLEFPKQYDAVISDLSSDQSDVWVAGAASLDTLEFYRAVGARLKPGGIFVQCLRSQGLLPDDLDLLTATFHAAFPHLQIWTSAPGNLLLLGTRDYVAWNYARLEQDFTHTQGVAEDLNSIGIWHPFALFGAQILGENEANTFTRNIEEFNTDDRPTLEFRTPRSLYVETTSKIAKELNPFRRPEAAPITGFDPQRDLDADGAYLLGFAYASRGQSDLAIRYMERSTTMAPNRPMFLVGLGNQYRAAGRVFDARTAYERALALDLNNLEALVSLGEIRLDEGQMEWTRVLTDRALRLAPQNARVHALIDRLQETER